MGDWDEFHTEAVTIVRRTPNGLNFTSTPVYNGNADLQDVLHSGHVFVDPAGLAASADALLIIDAATVGALPVVQIGDVAQYAGFEYTVVGGTTPVTFAIIHLELQLKRGILDYHGPK